MVSPQQPRSLSHSPKGLSIDSPRQIETEEEANTVAHQAENSIEVGDSEEAEDTGYESDFNSRASTSLSSSIRDYAFENGRRYHKYREGQYQFPNDEPEQE